MNETPEQQKLPHITASESAMRLRMLREGWSQKTIDLFFDRSPIMGKPARIPEDYIQIGTVMVRLDDRIACKEVA